MNIDDPITFFCDSPLNESLIFRFVHHAENAQVEIVYDYAAEAVSAHFERVRKGLPEPKETFRDFRRLFFSGTHHVTCHRRPWPGFGMRVVRQIGEFNIFQAVTRMDVSRCGDRWKAVMEITQYGPYEFSFDSVQWFRRLAVAERAKDGKGWVYRDSGTGEELDFDRPFDRPYE
jgi:hypothetical protein